MAPRAVRLWLWCAGQLGHRYPAAAMKLLVRAVDRALERRRAEVQAGAAGPLAQQIGKDMKRGRYALAQQRLDELLTAVAPTELRRGDVDAAAADPC
jgi:hypothetical protein